jgi:mannosyl-oligosaccharide alpha-1,2-mannosidase
LKLYSFNYLYAVYFRKTGHSAGIFGSNPTKLGATIVDGLDTMLLMGFTDEFERGKKWITENLNLDVVRIDFVELFFLISLNSSI